MSAMREKEHQKRSASELRESLAKNRERIDSDLSELAERFHDVLNPRSLLSRHPILTAGVGTVLGFLVIRHPGQLVRAASRLATLGAPLLLSALIKGDGSGSSKASEPSPTTDHS